MTNAILVCTAIAIAVATASGGTIGTNHTKREILQFYPDWVPFKNKHGDELGEFVDVTKPKSKVKKRLALPMNYLMKASDDDSEDFFGQGESDGEDEYEKKDWSDINRPVINSSEPAITLKTSDNNTVLKNDTEELSAENSLETENKSIPKQIDKDEDKSSEDNAEVLENVEKQKDLTSKPVEQNRQSKEQSSDDYEDEVEPSTKKPELSEEEQRENERKKKLILDSVDQLKQRHEQEQRAISEKEKPFDDEYHPKNTYKKKNWNHYDSKRQRGKVTTPDYEEYEDLSWKDKYNVNVERKTSTEEQPVKISEKHSKKRKRVRTRSTTEKNLNLDRGRYSVFRNPKLYMVDYEDLNEKDNILDRTTKKSRFSSKYTSSTPRAIDSAENDVNPGQITSGEAAEPILYFPKLKPKRKQKKSKVSTTSAPDSFVAETVEDRLTNKLTTQPMSYPDTARDTTEDYKTTAIENVYPTKTDSLWKEERSVKLNDLKNKRKDLEGDEYHDTTANEDLTTAAESVATEPTGEAESSYTHTVSDAVPAPSHHAKEEPKDYHVEKGGGHEHHSSHEEEHEEHGKKAYEGLHKDTKSKKGHHDKEDHLGKYEDKGGHNKEHHDESGHYGAHHHEEHGKKQAKYEESGKHSKGHSTKGSHDIHKKEEYEKNVEFFEEEGDSAEEEKHGGYHNEKEHKSGGQFKKGILENNHHEKKKGESGHFLKGGHHDVSKDHKLSAGHDGHGKRGGAQHNAGGHHGGKKWVYHHGYPAKNANLIVIDRRADRYMHGPNYYG